MCDASSSGGWEVSGQESKVALSDGATQSTRLAWQTCRAASNELTKNSEILLGSGYFANGWSVEVTNDGIAILFCDGMTLGWQDPVNES